MRRLGSGNLVPLDTELESTIRKFCKNKREVANLLQAPMDDLEGGRDEEDMPPRIPRVANPPMALRDYVLPLTSIQLVI